MDHLSFPHSHRMSYESFTFVGLDDPVTYLQCDILICDNKAPDRRCRDRKCLEDNVRRRRRHHSEDLFSGLRTISRPMIFQLVQRHKPRKMRSIRNTPVSSKKQPFLSLTGSLPSFFWYSKQQFLSIVPFHIRHFCLSNNPFLSVFPRYILIMK